MAGYSWASWANWCARNGCITKDTPPPFDLPSTTFGYSPTDPTYYRWRKEYSGMKLDQGRRLKELEKVNGRLKRLLAEAELDKAVLREAASGSL
jgi:hypothetical protein